MTAVRLAPASDPGSDARRRRRALWVLAAAAALVVAAVAVDAAAGTVTPPRPAPVRREAARAGTWYCPAVARAGERAVLTAAAVGDEPSRVAVDRYTPSGVARGDVTTVEPGAAATVALEGDDARHPVAVRWSGGPVAATWRVDGDRTAAAPCEPTPAATWHIPGFDTTLGSRSRLHLFNPFPTDAVVRLVFATPAGPVRLVLSDNLVAAGGRTTTFNLARFQPEIPDLGVTVEVLTGRVVAQGELLADPPGDIPGTTGRTLLPGAPEPSLTWYAPYAQQGDGTESWLAVLNPSDREAAVEIRVSAPAGGAGLTGEVSIPAGGVGRVELAQTSEDPVFGVSVAGVNDVPVVVTRMTALRAAGGRPAVTAALAATAPGTRWALAGGGTRGRSGHVYVYNPGPEPATVDLGADGAPAEWDGVRIGPNALMRFALTAAGDGRASLPVLVTSDQPVVTELRSVSSGDRLRPWSAGGVPASAWTGPAQRRPVRLDPTLATRPAAAPAPPEDLTDPAAPLPGDGADGARGDGAGAGARAGGEGARPSS